MKEEVNDEVTDSFLDHATHTEIRTDCSSCFSENGASVDQINDKQESHISLLRQSIEKKRQERLEEERQIHLALAMAREPKKRVLISIPEVTVPAGNSVFDLQRHAQLCSRVDALYNNYLVSKGTDDFEIVLKELSVTHDELLDEGLKTKF